MRVFFLILALTPLLQTGCKDGLGARCNVNADCANGLECIIPVDGDEQTGGVCVHPPLLDIGVSVSNTDMDTTLNDSGLNFDLGISLDSGDTD